MGWHGNLWVGTVEGVNRYDRTLDSFVHYPSGRVHIYSIFEDQEGMIWLATQEGLKSIDPTDNSVKVYLRDSLDPTSLSSTSVFAVLADSENRIWIGTSNGLDLWDPISDSFQHFRGVNGDEDSLVGSVVADIAFWSSDTSLGLEHHLILVSTISDSDQT